jgi:DNA-binding IclR family transcriptional regulator
VFSRVLILLESFDQEHSSLTIAELTQRSGLPAPTVYRVVRELLETGLLERGEDREVRIGVRLWELASLAPRALGLRVAAMPFMEDLQSTVRQHTVLSVLEGQESVVVEKLSSREAVPTYHRLGGRLPLHATTGGLILLAHADRKLQDAILTSPLRVHTPDTPTDPAVLRRILAGVREHGYVVCRGYISPLAMGVGVPVWSAHGRVVAALSVAIPISEGYPMAYLSALMVASRGISRALSSPQPQKQLPRFSWRPNEDTRARHGDRGEHAPGERAGEGVENA